MEKELIYIMKSLAIFSVVCAHVATVPESANEWNCATSDFLSYLGTMGVPVFFLLSGYLFERNKRSFGDFWKGKVKSVFIPWVFCETLLWLYVVLRKGGITLKAWVLFIIGYKHTTYYLTVLVIMYLLFWGIKRNWELAALILVSLLSMICTGWGFGISFINEWTGTYYLNPLNWMGFFVVGMLISGKNYLMCFASKLGKVVPFFAFASILYFAIVRVSGGGFAYFSQYALAAHIVNISLIFGLAENILRISGRTKELAIYIGKTSFSIYLLHQFVAGILVRVANYFDVFLITLMRPIVAIIAVIALIHFLKKIGNKKIEIVDVLIGSR